MIRTLTLIFVLSAAACGGKKPAPATTSTTQHADGAEGSGHDASGHEGHHEEMPAEMKQFHDVLKPRWHAEKGPQRIKDTCAAVPEFRSTGDALAKATPPTKANADTWTSATRALIDSIGGLEAACKTNDATKFEAAFTKLHDSFHALMAAAGMEHGKGEHKM